MDHSKNVENFLAGRGFEIPLTEMESFYDALLIALDEMGNGIVHRVERPMMLAAALITAGRDCVIDKTRDGRGERALRIALRIVRQVAPDADEILAENLRLLGIILCRLGKHADAQRCNIEAAYCAQRAGLSL
jgi:hypothetical protein